MSECDHGIRPGDECDESCVAWYCRSHGEDGWYCFLCKKDLGFRPDLDRRPPYLLRKVEDVMQDMTIHNMLSVSNGQMGEILSRKVGKQCYEDGRCDQSTIIQRLVAMNYYDEHIAYIEKASNEWLKEHGESPNA